MYMKKMIERDRKTEGVFGLDDYTEVANAVKYLYKHRNIGDFFCYRTVIHQNH